MDNIICGFDVGASGALAVINEDGMFVDVIDYSDDIADTIKKLNIYNHIKMMFIEKVSSMPNQGIASTFTFGMKYGEIQAICKTLKIPFVLVRPQEWQKGMALPKDKKERKKAINNSMKSMYPTAQLNGAKGGIKDGRSDALAIATWGRKTYGL